MIIIKEIIVRTIGEGIEKDPRRIDLPTYRIIEILPDHKVRILVPDDEVDENGKLSKDKIRQKYRGQKWDRPNVCDNVIVWIS